MADKIRKEIKVLEVRKQGANRRTAEYLNARIAGLETALKIVVKG